MDRKALQRPSYSSGNFHQRVFVFEQVIGLHSAPNRRKLGVAGRDDLAAALDAAGL